MTDKSLLPDKCFERLVLINLKVIIASLLDSFQVSNRPNRSVEDVLNMGLYFILKHLDTPD